jgi:hypothetical protein
LFPDPKPTLPKVRSCRDCNGDPSLDEEYFRNTIVLEIRAQDHPSAQEVSRTAMRGLAMPEKEKTKEAFLRTLTPVNLRTARGIYPTFLQNVDLERLRRVVRKIVRGLHFIRTGMPLAATTTIDVFTSDEVDAQNAEFRATVRKIAEQPVSHTPDTAFAFWFAPTEVPGVGAWILLFYRGVCFVALTFPEGLHPGRSADANPA